MKRYPNQPLVIEKYNPEWPELYEKEKEKITKQLGDHLVAIEHIGSTAIPGLSAKPVIDIVVAIIPQEESGHCLKLLEELNYEYVDKPEQWYLRKSTGLTTGFHLHMVVGKDSSYWIRALAIKKYLLSHPEAQIEYKKLKEKLFKHYKDDRLKYREGKSEFMKKMAEVALKEHKIKQQ
jgi:GrpB-like predicted nucleotidyltransferase (UPF0157 family)